ncbi:MAG: hypothetical protein R3191_01190 [Anaerolineales bacterium]|nr:hypothetical protein [Anaerolineales bacterium]
MNLRYVFRSLGPIDLRGLMRDDLLAWMVFMPFVIVALLRFGVPPLVARVFELTGFDLGPYIPVLLAVYVVMMTPLIFGMLVGFLLLEEKEDDTIRALQVSPLSLRGYLTYRIAAPTLLSLLLTPLLFPLTGLAEISLHGLFLLSAAAAPLAPLLALFLAAFASNKVQGFALMKGLGGVMMLPVLTYFIPGTWQLVFGVMPTYWPLWAYWSVEAGTGAGWIYALVGIVYQAGLIGWLARRLGWSLHRQ